MFGSGHVQDLVVADEAVVSLGPVMPLPSSLVVVSGLKVDKPFPFSEAGA